MADHQDQDPEDDQQLLYEEDDLANYGECVLWKSRRDLSILSILQGLLTPTCCHFVLLSAYEEDNQDAAEPVEADVGQDEAGLGTSQEQQQAPPEEPTNNGQAPSSSGRAVRNMFLAV